MPHAFRCEREDHQGVSAGGEEDCKEGVEIAESQGGSLEKGLRLRGGGVRGSGDGS